MDICRITWQVTLVEQEVFTLQEHLGSPTFFKGVRAAWAYVFCVVFSHWASPDNITIYLDLRWQYYSQVLLLLMVPLSKNRIYGWIPNYYSKYRRLIHYVIQPGLLVDLSGILHLTLRVTQQLKLYNILIRRGFAPDLSNYKKGALDSQPQVITFLSCSPMVGGSNRKSQNWNP
jgi:hypothetical protein